jgi:hypothetical protein
MAWLRLPAGVGLHPLSTVCENQGLRFDDGLRSNKPSIVPACRSGVDFVMKQAH